MSWTVPKIWQGGRCFIIGGGPSIIKQFNIPDNVVQGVLEKRLPLSVYSPFMKSIHKEHIIGVNVAYKFGNWVDIMFFGDDSTWREEKDELMKFSGLTVTCSTVCSTDKRVRFIKRNPRKGHGLSNDPTMLSWNSNSGAAAINFAVLLGVKKIVLLGFDMKLGVNGQQHWHNQYNSGLKGAMSAINRHLRGFPDIAKDAKEMGIEILNANPDSAIDVFPKVNLKDIL